MFHVTQFCMRSSARGILRKAQIGERPLGMTKASFERRRATPGATKFWRRNRPEERDPHATVATSFITGVGSRTAASAAAAALQQEQQQQQFQSQDQQRQEDEDEGEGDDDGERDDDGGYEEDFLRARSPPASSSSSIAADRSRILALNSAPPSSRHFTPVGFRMMQHDDHHQHEQQHEHGEHCNHGGDEAAHAHALATTVDNQLASTSAVALPSSTLEVGHDVSVKLEHSPMRQKLKDTPIPFLSSAFDTGTRKTQIVLPQHLNSLFAKISKMKTALAELPPPEEEGGSGGNLALDNRTGTLDNPSPEAVAANPQLAKHAAARAKEKLQYGALMDAFESDRHAQEHRLAVAGTKFERRFMNWQGAKLLENVPQQQMHDTLQSKGSLLLHSPRGFKIPRIDRDACSGCGATLQNRDEHGFGYVYPGDVEQYVLSWQAVFRARAEYAERMHELMAHWERHGKRVGEEWLDFMTQDEFNAVFRFIGRPFVCRRCIELRSYGTNTSNTLLSAPDFKDKLASLRDKRCLVVLVVDLCDFPGSMVPELPGLISMNNPVIIAANKLDCVNPVSFQYRGTHLARRGLRVGAGYIKQWVREQALQFRLPVTQIKSVVPVSAQRGWGIRELIAAIELHSNLTFNRPDRAQPLPTYFVGVSNVGKSSVINAIAHELYVPQPPHPSSTKQFYTYIDRKTGVERVASRWITDKRLYNAEMDVMRSTRDRRVSALVTTSPLPGTTINAIAVRVSLNGRSGSNDNSKSNNSERPTPAAKAAEKTKKKKQKWDDSTFFFDTPGLHPLWHETSPFNLRDQVSCLMQRRRNPQASVLTDGFTLFFSAAACVDVVKAQGQDLMFFAYHTERVTTRICETPQADAFWREHAGRTLTPPGSRLNLMPQQYSNSNSNGSNNQEDDDDDDAAFPVASAALTVKRSYLFECHDNHRKRPKADIYFCGLGWVSFFARNPCDVVLRVRTLPGIVHGVRRPLRKNDMKPFRPWPRVPNDRRVLPEPANPDSKAAAKRNVIGDVIELENNPDAVDLSQPPIVPIEKQLPFSNSSSSSSAVNSMPFDFILGELAKQGKLKQ